MKRKSLAYQILYTYVRWMYKYCYCRTIRVCGKDRFDPARPTIYITTHQNNLPDALSLASVLEDPLYFVARADFFRNRWANVALRFLRILPIQRKGDGRARIQENLPLTMQNLEEHVESGGSCAIMPEGSSFPSRSLRPLKKGWARLLLRVQHVKAIRVVPVAIEYSDWNDWGPDVRLTFGNPLDLSLDPEDGHAVQLKQLNQRATEQLSQLISSDEQIEQWHKEIQKERRSVDLAFKWLGFPLLLVFLIVNAPIHLLARYRVRSHSREDFKSTLEVGFIGLSTPLWFLILGIAVGVDLGWSYTLYGTLVLPLFLWISARSLIAWKHS